MKASWCGQDSRVARIGEQGGREGGREREREGERERERERERKREREGALGAAITQLCTLMPDPQFILS